MSRTHPALIAIEVAAVLAIAIAPMGYIFPAGVPLLAVASLSRWVRGLGWEQVLRGTPTTNAGDEIATGIAGDEITNGVAGDEIANDAGDHAPRANLGRAALTGAITGALAIAVAAPLLGLSHVTALDWWIVPAARGGAAQLVPALAVLFASVFALELSLRGWIMERVFELSPGSASVPIATAAIAEALITGGPVASRIGIGLFSAGLGTLYVASGRTVIAPITARCTFLLGAVLVERFA